MDELKLVRKLSTFTKVFEVNRKIFLKSALPDIFSCVNYFNSAKIGRNSRGQIMITAVDYDTLPNGQIRVEISFARNRRRWMRFANGVTGKHLGKYCIYETKDFRPILRRLGKSRRPTVKP